MKWRESTENRLLSWNRLKGGTLAVLPEEAENIFRKADPEQSPSSWAIRYAAFPGRSDNRSVGHVKYGQMRDNISFMSDFKPLTQKERKVRRSKKFWNPIRRFPCTHVVIVWRMPESVAIYGTFQAVNIFKRYQDLNGAKGKYKWNTEGHGWGKASACIGCGACEAVCPQHISIRESLKSCGNS